jgi:CRP/FNR family transcriptional regulator, cyclic AMP receptor protein
MTTLTLFRYEEHPLLLTAAQEIFQIGQRGDRMYVVLEGEVELSLPDRIIETVQPGGIFGEVALLDDRPRSATALAKTDCKLAAVDQERFAFLVQHTPFFAIEVMRVMADRLRRETLLHHNK